MLPRHVHAARPTDAIRTRVRGKSADRNGELPDGVRGKGRSSAWGLGVNSGNRDGGMRIDCEGTADGKFYGKLTQFDQGR